MTFNAPAVGAPTNKEASRLTKEEWREYTKTVWQIANVSDPDHPAVFPYEIPYRLIKLFSFVGETVLDPFAGTGVTGQAALTTGRHSILVDQNENYTAIARERLTAVPLLPSGTPPCTDIRTADSRNLAWLQDSSVNLVVTSPPYWNKADYGSGKVNLGSNPHYLDFIDSLRPVFSECMRVLEPGRKMCIVTANVNQHTDQGLLTFPLAADLTMIAREIGFVLINEVIWNKSGTGGRWGSYGSQRPIFGSYPYPPNLLFKNVHEYILILAKPHEKPKKGKTVIPLEDLM